MISAAFPKFIAAATLTGLRCLGFIFLAWPGAGLGHDTLSSRAVARVGPDGVELKIKMTADAAWPVAQKTVAPGKIFVLEEFDTVGRPLLVAFAKTLEEVSVDGRVIEPEQVDVAVLGDYFEFRLLYRVSSPRRFRLNELYLQGMSPGYASHVTILDNNGRLLASDLLSAGHPLLELPLPFSPEPAGAALAAGSPPRAGFREFLQLGVVHIITGYDHLLFLCGLLVACRRVPSMLVIITSFTLGHSLTLALAALDLVVPPGRLVESVIAGSIVYVGVENLLCRGEPRGRAVLTFVFGLVHGFGFAGVLREIGLGAGGTSIVRPLLSFNLGVEFGQIGVVLVLLPALLALRRRPAFERWGVPAVSAVVALAGACWLVRRALFSA